MMLRRPRGPLLALAALAALLLVLATSVSCGLVVSFNAYDTSLPLYSVGGTIDGLGGEKARLLLNGQNATDFAEGQFRFPASVGNGESYIVTVEGDPPHHMCSPSTITGTVAGANVSDVSIHCFPSNNALLTSLSLSAGTEAQLALSPAFDPNIEKYTLGPIAISALLPPRSTTTVTATAQDSAVGIRIAGENRASGTASSPIPLDSATSIEIVVTAADGTTKKTYTVTVLGRPSDFVKASNTRAAAAFGSAIALSDDTLVVGARRESTLGIGAHADQGDKADRAGFESGAAYVFSKTGTGSSATWSQTAFLKASNTKPRPPDDSGEGAGFGFSVALSGNTLVVGANNESSNAKGVNGDQADTSAKGAGAVYVFVRAGVGAPWSQQAYIKASNTGGKDSAFFGAAVALSGDTLAVGAPGEPSLASGVDASQTPSSQGAGAVYVFTRTGTGNAALWSQQSYIKPSNTHAQMTFGTSVALSGDTLVAGATGEASSAKGLNGDQTDQSAPGAGAVYIFTRTSAVWSQQAYVKASNASTRALFGAAVAIAGDTLAVGASGDSSLATGIDGNQTPVPPMNGTTNGAGAVYVFTRKGAGGTTWSQQSYIKASNTAVHAAFGTSVALSGDTLTVGAPFESSGASGVNGNQLDLSQVAAGAAYLFTRSGTTWTQRAYAKASSAHASAHFGERVALAGTSLAVGEANEGSDAKGVNGAPGVTARQAGAVHVFR